MGEETYTLLIKRAMKLSKDGYPPRILTPWMTPLPEARAVETREPVRKWGLGWGRGMRLPQRNIQ